MGMFDTIMVPCPECGKKNEFQTKSGDCLLEVYELGDCPPEVMMDVNRHSPHTCEKCGVRYEVKLTITGVPVKVTKEQAE